MVTLLIAGRRSLRRPGARLAILETGTSARNEVRCWIANAHSQRKRFTRAQQRSYLTSQAARSLPTGGRRDGLRRSRNEGSSLGYDWSDFRREDVRHPAYPEQKIGHGLV